MKRCFCVSKLVAVAALIYGLVAISSVCAAPQAQKIFPMPNKSVHPDSTTPFGIAEQKVLTWLLNVDPNRILYIWRQNYGQSTGTASPMGGWEAPGGALRGHMTGHILSALAMMGALTGNATIKAKEQILVKSLDTCQLRDSVMGWPKGFLSAYDTMEFYALEHNGTYGGNPNVWAPYYTQHKIMAGLIKCYQDLGDTLALRMAEGMGYWAYGRLSKCTYANLQSMWSRYIAGEYGGYNESAAELYMITGDTTFRALARLMDDYSTTGASLTNLDANTDALSCTHANMYMPRITGYMRVWDATDTAKYYTACLNFWPMVVNHHSFAHGGVNACTSNAEAFDPPDNESIRYNDNGSSMETCPSYNFAKFSKAMFWHEGNPMYLDYVERAYFNQLLCTFGIASYPNPTADYTDWYRYGTPVMNNENSAPAGMDLSGDGFTCCGGTSTEDAERFYEGVYDSCGDTLYITNFIASTLTRGGLVVKMATKFPESDTVKLYFTSVLGSTTMPVKIRAGWWKRSAWTVSIDGTPVNVIGTGAQSYQIPPGSFFRLPKTAWSGVDSVVIYAPQTPRFILADGSTTMGYIMFGPLAMTYPGASALATINASSYTRTPGTSTLSMGGVTLTPTYRVTASYNTYCNISNMPATWNDTMLETQVATYVDNPVVRALTAMNAPTVTLANSQILVSFSASMTSDQRVAVNLFNAQGVRIALAQGMVHKGDRSVTLHQNALPAGLYVCSVVTGERKYYTALICSK